MDFFTKNKFSFWIIVLLVMLNILTLTVLWVQKFRPLPPPGSDHPMEMNRPGNVQHFLKRELHLSDQQAHKMEKFRQQHFLKSRKVRRNIHRLKKQIMDELFQSSVDSLKINKLAFEIGNRQAELETLLFYHFMDLKSICEPGQEPKLKRLFIDIVEKMKLPQNKRPPRRLHPARQQRGKGEGF